MKTVTYRSPANDLRNATTSAAAYIDALEIALLYAVSEKECGKQQRCGSRYWDNRDCACARAARKYLPTAYQDT